MRAAAGCSRRPAAQTVRTTAHEILDVESKQRQVKPSAYALLNSIIDVARLKLPPAASIPTDGPAGRQGALDALTTIDGILVNRHFIYPGIGLVTYLSEGLTPKVLSKDEFQAARDGFHNIRRIARMNDHASKPFYVVDCDIASFIYLAVGEALHLPIALVEVPGHDFIRWTFHDGTHLNFGPWTGWKSPMLIIVESYNVPDDIIKPGLFMHALSHDDIMGYVIYLRGGGWGSNDYAKARQDYIEAIRLRPASPEPRDELAWSYATCSTPACRDAKQALTLATENVAIWRRALYLDTLACAYAASGDFAKAVPRAKEVLAFDWEENFRGDLDASPSRSALFPSGKRPEC